MMKLSCLKALMVLRKAKSNLRFNEIVKALNENYCEKRKKRGTEKKKEKKKCTGRIFEAERSGIRGILCPT